MLGLLLTFIAIYFFKTKKFYHSLIIFFLLITNGFQLIPVKWITSGIPLEKASDFAILYVIYIAWSQRGSIKKILYNFPVFKYCLYILFFVTLDALYSFISLNYSLVNILQVFRPYFFFLSFIIFFSIPLNVLIKTLNLLVVVTTIQGVFFLFQIITGKPILLSASGLENITTNVMGGYTRFYNTPILLNVSFFYVAFVYKFRNRFFQIASQAILTLTIIGPMHRSLIISIIAVCSIFVLLRQSVSKKMIYLSFIGVIIYGATFVDVFNNRMIEAFSDIQSTFSSNITAESIDIQENTTLFRIGHFLERSDYVSKIPFGWLFGIGLISDNATYASKLPFVFGLTSDVTGQVVQIDSSDLIWSPLILNLGFVGTILYTIVFIHFIIFFYKNFNKSLYSTIGFLIILLGFFISTMSIEMLSNGFRVIVMLIAVIVCKDKYVKVNKSQID